MIPGSGRSAGEERSYPLQYSWVSLGAQHLQVGNLGSIPGLGKSHEEVNALQYSDLENSMNCIVHGVTKNWIQFSDFHFHFENGELGTER